MKRTESSNHYFRQRIPLDVLEQARGTTLTLPCGDTAVTKVIAPKATEVKVSLQTSDPSAAKIRQGNIAAYLEGVWQSLRNGPIALSHKQTVALAGELYGIWISSLENNPGSIDMWDRVARDNSLAQDGGYGRARLMIAKGSGDNLVQRSLEERFGPFADTLLAKKALVVDSESRVHLLKQVAGAMDEAVSKVRKFAGGDYRADDVADRGLPLRVSFVLAPLYLRVNHGTTLSRLHLMLI